MNMRNRYLIIALILLSLFGCEKNPTTPEYQKEVAIFGYLWCNKPITADRAIMITYTQPIDAYYDLDQAAIQEAKVTITEVNSGKLYELEDSDKPGFYFNDSLIAKPKTTYVLEIVVADTIVTAMTTVPPTLAIQTELSTDKVDSVYHDNLSKEKPIFIDCESEEQIIVVDVYCNESWENAEYINPFWGRDRPEEREEYGGQDGNSEPRHIVAVAKFKELFSTKFPGRNVIDWYSSMIGFYGSYMLQVLAIDDNYYNFINKNEYPELQSGVNGGIGVFGSVSGETFRLHILKP